MESGTDASGNEYFHVQNVRITAKPETCGKKIRGLSIRAYKSKDTDALFPGPEIPIPDRQTAYEFIGAVFKALEKLGL